MVGHSPAMIMLCTLAIGLSVANRSENIVSPPYTSPMIGSALPTPLSFRPTIVAGAGIAAPLDGFVRGDLSAAGENTTDRPYCFE
jgi:hypothetical protein